MHNIQICEYIFKTPLDLKGIYQGSNQVGNYMVPVDNVGFGSATKVLDIMHVQITSTLLFWLK